MREERVGNFSQAGKRAGDGPWNKAANHSDGLPHQGKVAKVFMKETTRGWRNHKKKKIDHDAAKRHNFSYGEE